MRVADVIVGSMFVFAFLIVASSSPLGRLAPSDFELPLGDLDSIGLDGQGNVYCAALGYNRIQVYDSHGEFLRSIHVPLKPYYFSIDSQGNLHVWIGSVYRQYSQTGELVRNAKISAPPEAALEGSPAAKEVVDQQGNIYTIDTHLFVSERVLKTDPSGKTEVLVSQPWYLVMAKWPNPSFLYVGIGLFYFLLVKWLIKTWMQISAEYDARQQAVDG